MTNLIKRKNLLFLTAVVVMIAMMSVACKKKVTQPADFSVTGDGTTIYDPVSPEDPATPEEPVPEPVTDDGLLDALVGNVYKTTPRFANANNRAYYFQAEILKDKNGKTYMLFTSTAGERRILYRNNTYTDDAQYGKALADWGIVYVNIRNGGKTLDVKPANYNGLWVKDLIKQ